MDLAAGRVSDSGGYKEIALLSMMASLGIANPIARVADQAWSDSQTCGGKPCSPSNQRAPHLRQRHVSASATSPLPLYLPPARVLTYRLRAASRFCAKPFVNVPRRRKLDGAELSPEAFRL